ncbi:hypothetical protein CHARACLAT_015332 [Characodon lateralis]|uniref:Uncharacterized protein n=1 Tax=Characodon lateralis TaxID=208331 RepID=A0ABU7CZS9_9TELE|nr:hypothetical protein [Characodon lateralis]
MPSAGPLPHCAPDHKGFDNRRNERARSKDVCMTRRKPSPRMCESFFFFLSFENLNALSQLPLSFLHC